MRVALIVWGLLLVAGGWAQQRLRLETGIGHTSALKCATISPDGRYVLTAGDDSAAHLWDVSSGKEICRYLGHGNPVNTAVFSPDGKQILTASYDRTVRLWETTTGVEIQRLEIPAFAQCAAFSPDGTQIVIGSSDGFLRIWDKSTWKELRKLEGHRSLISSVAYSLDAKQILSASFDATARLWDSATGNVLHAFEGHSQPVFSASFSADGKYVTTGSLDNSALLWDARTGKELRKFVGHTEAVWTAVMSPDSKLVLTASKDQTVRLWDAVTCKEIRRFEGHTDWVSSATFAGQATQVITSSYDRTARLWDADTAKELKRFSGLGAGLWAATMTPDGKQILTASYDRFARLWEPAIGKGFRTFEGHRGGLSGVVFSANGRHALTSSYDKTARLWTVDTGKEVRSFEGHASMLWSAVFSPEGNQVLTSSSDRTARLWDVTSGKEIRKFEGHGDLVYSATFAQDGKTVVTASYDKIARLWDTWSGKLLHQFVGHNGPVRKAVFSSDNTKILTASFDGTARLWDIATEKETQRFEVKGVALYSAVFSPDGRYIVTACADRTARLFETSTGTEVRRLDGSTYGVSSAEFTPNGLQILTASGDGTSRLWDVATGNELCACISYRDGSWSVIDPAGRYDSSDGGQNPNLYWVLEDRTKGVLDTIGVDQIGSYFYTPDLLGKCMRREVLPQVEKLEKLPIFPKLDDLKVDQSKATFTLTDRGGGIGEIKAFVGGQLVKTIHGKPGKNSVDLGGTKGDVQVVAYNSMNTLASPRSTATIAVSLLPSTPTRYVAVIAGIETYAGPGLKPLNYAADDAVAIARSVLACAKGLKITPDIYVLSSAPEAQDLKKEGITVLPATKAAFKDVFTKILPAGGKWRDSDLMFLYFSGHGGSYKEGNLSHYAYYTEDARDADLSIKRDEWAVTDVELVEWLAKFPGGKRAMILDTCAAGAATELLAQAKDDADRERAMLDTNRNTGMSVLFGSAESAASWESNGHGLLTYSILQALATQQDLGEGLKDAVRVDTLFSRAEGDTRKEAERLGLRQEPRKFGRGQNFPIGFLDDAGRKAIPYQSPVPLFGKPSLINSATGLDDLDLMAQLGDALRRSSQPKSGEPLPLRYVPDSPAAVQIQGAYTISGDRVTVIMNLLEKGKAPVPIKVEASKQELVDAAVKAIITWARGKSK